MWKRHVRSCAATGLVLAWLSCGTPWSMADDRPAAAADGTITEIPYTEDQALVAPTVSEFETESEGLPAEFQDPAYDRFVNLEGIREAIANHDAEQLTDVALALAEGERVLLRPHHAGISADKVLSAAVRLAIHVRDKSSLDRLARVAESRKLTELATQIAAGQQLAGAARSVNPALTVSLEAADVDTVTDVKGWLDLITEAAAVGDRLTLQALAEALSDAENLSDEHRSALQAQIEQAIANAPEPDAEDAVLQQLAGGTRAESDRQSVRDRITSGGWYIVWGKTVATGDYVKLVASIASGTVAAYFGELLEANITKMQKQLPGVARSVLLDAVKRALKGGSIVRVGKLGIKGGIATYRYWNVITVKVPDGTEKYKIKGPFGSWTWGYRPKFKTVTKQVPAEPNNHQPYFGFRVY